MALPGSLRVACLALLTFTHVAAEAATEQQDVESSGWKPEACQFEVMPGALVSDIRLRGGFEYRQLP